MSVTFDINGAPVELLEVGQLLLLNDKQKQVDTFLLDRFFPNRLSFARKDVPVGEIDTVTPLAPFVSPNVAARQIKTGDSGNVKFVKPAYLKPQMSITPADVFDTVLITRLRQAGVLATGTNRLTDAEALLVDQIQKSQTIINSIQNRKLMMARDCLLTGRMTFASDDFPSITVDYERDAACTFVPTVKWDANGATPVTDINAMIAIAVDKAGASPTAALMSSKVWGALSANPEFKAQFETPLAGISVAYTPTFNDPLKPQLRGTFGGIQFWTYDGTYKFSGAAGRFIPADYFGLVADASGYVAHCAIQNLKAFGQPLEYFMDQWQENNPSSIQLVGESSPLIVPNNKNGVVGGTGFVTI